MERACVTMLYYEDGPITSAVNCSGHVEFSMHDLHLMNFLLVAYEGMPNPKHSEVLTAEILQGVYGLADVERSYLQTAT